jgi:uncharacterized membrane protein
MAAGGSAPPPPPPPQPPYTPPQQGYVPPQQGYGPPPAQGLGMDENLAAALCYIPIIGLIFLLLDPYNKNRTIRFHAWQSILYCAAWIVIMIGLTIFVIMLHLLLPTGMALMISMVLRLVQLALFVILIFAAVKAYQRDRLFLPVIGPIAEKQAG